VLRGQHDGSLRPYSRLSRPEPLLFLSSSASVVLTRLSGYSQFFLYYLRYVHVILHPTTALGKCTSTSMSFSFILY
jgi:hypothetical protein